MSEKTKHTPKPLFVDGHAVKRPDGSTFCVADTPGEALVIAESCNAHEELKAQRDALLEAVLGIQGICKVSPTGPFKKDIAQICDTAIARAEKPIS